MSVRRVPALHALAPTESEPPFQQTQLAVLVLFILLGIIAVRRFRLNSAQAGPAVLSDMRFQNLGRR